MSTLEQKFGYRKKVKDTEVEISGQILCRELELNPNILKLCGLTKDDPMITWNFFLKIMTLFLLQKDMLDLRFEFILQFLNP